jgi:hypothetical protein
MFRYVRLTELNRPQWDALIQAAPNGMIYALTWYLDSVAPGWEALVKEEAGRYVAVLPLPVRRKLGFKYLQQPLLTQQLGLFYAPDAPPTAADWQQIGALLRQHFRYITRYSFNTDNAEVLDLSRLGSAFAPFTGAVVVNYHLSLRPPYAELRAGYSPNRRWRLNQARRRGWNLEPGTDIEQLIALFKEHTAGKLYGGVGEEAYHALRAVYAAASRAGLAALWQARPPGGEVGAMILLLRFRQQLIYLFSATDAAGKKAGAISLLLDAVVQAHAGQDLHLDFEAPTDKDVVHFYRSFGPAPAPFGTIALNQLPWPVRQLRAARMALLRRLAARPAPGNDAG